MTEKKDLLTAKEFAALMNISTSTLTKKLRKGEIRGEKISGKWMIAKSELKGDAEPAPTPRKAEPTSAPIPKEVKPSGNTVSVDEFAEKTFLTPAGVIAFLKEEKLIGSQDPEGNWTVDADSFDLPHIRHLVR